jgi:micrococcal nuclease
MVEKVVGTIGKRVVVGLALVAIADFGIVAVKQTGAAPIQESQSRPAQAEVATLVDGQTLEVRSHDQLTRIRLLDIVSPSAPDSEGHPPCLGPEASAFLASTIPVGTPLTLAYQIDQFGQIAATASTSEGTLVNAEIARAGFAEPVATNGDDGNDHTVVTVQTAAQDAMTNKRGLHSPAIGCTVPGQVKTVLEMVAKIPTTAPPGAGGIELTTLANLATDARAAAEELVRDFTQNRQDLIWTVLEPTERSQLQHLATQGRDQVAAAEVTLRAAANSAVNSGSTQAAAQAEANRIAKQLAAIRSAEARRTKAARRGRVF